MDSTSGRITAIVVEGLFGRRNYRIRLDEREPTVLTGANGTGKSTLLRLLNAVSNGDVETLVRAPLRYFELSFENIPPFRMTRLPDSSGVTFNWGEHFTPVDSPENAEIKSLPLWTQRALSEYEDNDDIQELLLRYRPPGTPFAEYSRIRDLFEYHVETRSRLTPPEWFGDLQSAFQVLFISDQRLIVEPRLARGNPTRKPTRGGPRRVRRNLAIEQASSDIVRRIQDADSDYARVSQEQDRRFPIAVIEAMKQAEEIDASELNDLIDEVDAAREELRQVGLLDRTDDYEPKLEDEDLTAPNVRSVMATVMRSSLRKLAVLGDLAARLSTYKEFLDGRYAPKSVVLGRRDGIRIELEDETQIRPRELSSGEQQMAVIAYEILFKTTPNTLVIIDEPEISLHVIWQHSLIEDLNKMGRPSKLQFLMATHSPVILADHDHLERSLDFE